MTAEEKAQKLVYDLYNKVNDRETLNSMYKSKQCALIAVDEILGAIKVADNITFMYVIDWWKEVKQEIENL